MPVHSNDAKTRECPACHATVPATAFCGNCGAGSAGASGRWGRLLRPGTFAVAPAERVEWPLITSSMFPHLSEMARRPFRHGLFLVLAMLTVFSALRLLGPLVTVACLGIPLLFVLYLWRSEAYTYMSVPALAISGVLGAGLSTAWWLWTGDVVASAYGVPLGAASQLQYELGLGLSITMVGAVLMVLPAVAVRLLRLPVRESLDGFVVGAVGALCYTLAGTAVWLAPQYTAGLLNNFSSWRLLEESLLYGLVDPLTAAAAGGMVGIALWFRPDRRVAGHQRRFRGLLWLLAILCIGIFMAVYAVDATELPRIWEITINTGLTAVSMLAVRGGLQLALLYEAPDPAGSSDVRCRHCARTVPDMPFCPECGAATRAVSPTSRLRRKSGAPA